MTEKIAAANKLLNNNEYSIHERSVKVKFRENLVDYEPDYTSDEGSTYEKRSDVDDTIYDENGATDLDVQLQNKLNLDLANSDDDDDEILEEISDDDASIVPERGVTISDARREECFEDETGEEDTETLEEANKIDEYIATEVSAGERKKENVDPDGERKKSAGGKGRGERKTLKPKETNIVCKDQCAEKLADRSVNFGRARVGRLSAADPSATRRPVGPVLKLKKRKCCDPSLKPKLPEYAGLRSEYGLNPEQLEKRERLKALTRKRGILKKQQQREVREDRVQRNERIFCEWLKEISRRKEVEAKRSRKPASPYASPKSKSTGTKKKERPKTASAIYDDAAKASPPVKTVKKRPHTSTACVFIEVPRKCLQKGIQIGDLLVTKRSRSVKKLHVLTTAA